MRQKILNLIQATKLKNIVMLSSGAIVAQSIGIIIQPIATRLYSVEMFGRLALITSLVTMISPVLTLQYDRFIVIVSTEHEANIVTALSLRIGIIMSSLLAVGLIIYNHIFPYTFAEAGKWIYYSIPLFFISAFVQIVTMYNNRHEQYKLIASVSVIRAVFSGLFKIVLGLLQCGFVGLIASSFVANLAGINRQAKCLMENLTEIKKVTKSEMIQATRKYINQPLFATPGLFVNSLSYSILPLLITAMYGIKETGFFSQSILMLGLPLSLISGSVGPVFFKNASKERAEHGVFYSSFKNTTLLLFLLSIVPFIGLWIFAEPLFSFVFGTEWLRSGTFVKLLIPMYFVRFTVTVLTEALIITGRQKLKLLIQCIFAVDAMAAYVISKYHGLSLEAFLTIINYLYMVNYMLIFFTVMYESKHKVLTKKINDNS